jgi:L-fuculose-phosphate aldolase
LAHQYVHTLAIGGPVVLSDAEIEETARGFESYGVQAKEPVV